MLPRIDRRRFLSGMGISLALPSLESGWPGCALAAQSTPTNLQRLVCIRTYLGFHQASFFPSDTRTNYKISPVLSSVDSFRNEMTIFSGLDYRGCNGHEGWKAWMTGTATGGVSMDQLVAASVGDRTRFASLNSSRSAASSAGPLSWVTCRMGREPSHLCRKPITPQFRGWSM